MSTPAPGKYYIVSAATNKRTGVDIFFGGPPPPEQTVHLEGVINVWSLTRDIPHAPQVYLFALDPEYPWSGVDNLASKCKKVTAFRQPGPLAVHWFVNPVDDKGKNFTIAWDHDHDQLWTVADPSNPRSEIVLSEPGQGSCQWFRFEHAE